MTAIYGALTEAPLESLGSPQREVKQTKHQEHTKEAPH